MTSEIIIQAIVTGLMMGLIYALIAAGLSLIFGLMEIVNFAHGEHYDIEISEENEHKYYRIYIQKEDGSSVNLDECAEINRIIF
jgi:hypothetical protein